MYPPGSRGGAGEGGGAQRHGWKGGRESKCDLASIIFTGSHAKRYHPPPINPNACSNGGLQGEYRKPSYEHIDLLRRTRLLGLMEILVKI